MAVSFNDVTRKLSLVLEDGLTAAGVVKTKSRTFPGLSETASADKVQAAGKALGSLMNARVLSIYVQDTNEVLDGE